jgi:hypothetical protein
MDTASVPNRNSSPVSINERRVGQERFAHILVITTALAGRAVESKHPDIQDAQANDDLRK